MTYRGTVKDGMVELEGGFGPPEGSRVEVSVVDAEPPTWGEVFKELIGSAPQLPPDIAENHDHYIHGAPKRLDTE